MTPLKAETETFTKMVEQCRRGRLLLYLGPPAGQARRLAEAARYLSQRGLDVVLAFWEPAGGPGPGPGLESLPRRRLEYRGLAVEEMDLEAVLARRPQVAVVQDLTHANVPGGAHANRYQDARAILAAGISVLASADPWHLEGLPGVPPPGGPHARRQGLPASFWRRADQLVLLEEPSTAPGDPPGWQSLPAEALEALRGQATSPVPAEGQAAGPCQRFMVCLPAQAKQALALLRGVQDLPQRNGGSWFAVHVSPSPNSGGGEQLRQGCQEARRLGAEVVLLEGKDPLVPLLDFARAHGVRHIVLGRPRGAAWKGLFNFSLSFRLLRHASDFDLHIIDLAEPRT